MQQLQIRPIVEYPEAAILQQCAAFAEPYEGALSLIEEMKWSCAAGQGVGLAANQIGDLRRAIVYVGRDGRHHGLINPVIIEKSDATTIANEGCLSLPGLQVMIRRSHEIVVGAVDEQLQPVRLELTGSEARVVQHEVDHLDGKLIVDHNGRLIRKLTLDKWRKNYNKYVRQANSQARRKA